MPPTRYRYDSAIELEGQRRPVFPILMASTWERAATQVCQPLVAGVPGGDIPLLAPVYFLGEPGRTEFRRVHIRDERLAELGQTADQVMREALHNLEQRPATWSIVARQIALCDNDYLAAERVLYPDFMQRGAALLGDAEQALLVAIPRRGYLAVTPLAAVQQDSAHGRGFVGAARQLLAEAGEHALTARTFLVRGGRLLSVLDVE